MSTVGFPLRVNWDYGPFANKAFQFAMNMEASSSRAKRSRTGTTVTRKDDDDGDGFFTGQLNTYSVTGGTRKTAIQHAMKLINRNIGYALLRYGACNRLTDSVGAFQLRFAEPSGVRQYNDCSMPCHIVELCARNIEGAYSQRTHYAHTELRVLESAGNSSFQFSPLVGRIADGVGTTTDFEILNTNMDKSGNNFLARCNAYILEYTNVKMLLRAPTSRPGKFRVDLVQFLDEDINPLPVQITGAGDVVEYASRDAFYERFMSDYLYNPIKRQSKGVGRSVNANIRILKTWEKEFSPDSSTNRDGQGQQFHLNLFYRFNRYCNFNNKNGTHFAGTGAVGKLDDDVYLNEYLAGLGSSNVPPEPRSRVYLVIRATNWDAKKAPTDAFDPATECSYDMEVRNRWVFKTEGAA